MSPFRYHPALINYILKLLLRVSDSEYQICSRRLLATILLFVSVRSANPVEREDSGSCFITAGEAQEDLEQNVGGECYGEIWLWDEMGDMVVCVNDGRNVVKSGKVRMGGRTGRMNGWKGGGGGGLVVVDVCNWFMVGFVVMMNGMMVVLGENGDCIIYNGGLFERNNVGDTSMIVEMECGDGLGRELGVYWGSDGGDGSGGGGLKEHCDLVEDFDFKTSVGGIVVLIGGVQGEKCSAVWLSGIVWGGDKRMYIERVVGWCGWNDDVRIVDSGWIIGGLILRGECYGKDDLYWGGRREWCVIMMTVICRVREK
ncbi:hypothetical protein Tco_0595255 [Tanacetum coccineum]